MPVVRGVPVVEGSEGLVCRESAAFRGLRALAHMLLDPLISQERFSELCSLSAWGHVFIAAHESGPGALAVGFGEATMPA